MLILLAILAIACVLVPNIFIRLVIAAAGLLLFSFWLTIRSASNHQGEGKSKTDSKMMPSRELLSSTKLKGDVLLAERTKFLRQYREEAVAALCGYYVDTGKGSYQYRVDNLAYYKAIAEANSKAVVKNDDDYDLDDIKENEEGIDLRSALVGEDLRFKVLNAQKPINNKKLMKECGYFGIDKNGKEVYARGHFYEAVESLSKAEHPASSDKIKGNIRESKSNLCTKIKITVIESGGEYTVGTLCEPKAAAVIETINSGRMGSFGTLVDGESFEASNYDDLCHLYGPSIWNEAQIIVEDISFSGSGEDINSNIIFSGRLGDTSIGRINSHVDTEIRLHHDTNDLIICSGKTEKRIHFCAEMALSSEEPFDLSKLCLYTVNTDSPFPNDDDILDCILYLKELPMSSVIDVARRFYGNEFEDAWIEDEDFCLDTLNGIFDSDDKQCRAIVSELIKQHSAEVLSVEGKGEWESDYIKVLRPISVWPAKYKEELLFEK